MYSFNPDRRGLNEVKLLDLEPWRQYPPGAALDLDFLKQARPPRPRVTRQTLLASIGSCFAREIKVWLQANGFNFLQAAEGPCTRHGSARYDRVYNTFSLRQEFERAFGRFEPSETLWQIDDHGTTRLLDPYRRCVAWDSLEEMRQELEEHRQAVRRVFGQAQVLIVTVGQAEIWFNRHDGYVYPLVPPAQVFDAARHGFRLTTFQENLATLVRVLELFAAHNPGGHLLATLSPVPLRATFRRDNALIANSASKGILRAALDAFVGAHGDRVTYFPSYEIATVLEAAPFEDDNRHVRPETIGRIMELFQAWFVD